MKTATVKGSLAVTEKEFLDRVKQEMDEKPEIMLGRIETVPFLYLSDYVGLWRIAVDPGKTVIMCNATTGKIKVHKKVEETNIADLRVYKFRL